MKYEPYIIPAQLDQIDRWCRRFVMVVGPLLLLFLLTACSSIPADLVAHEERHCEGWEHTGNAPFYQWTKARPASAKPWFYVRVDDPDAICRQRVASAASFIRINGCAQWKPQGCEIILPR